jgi:hypothetical protein
MALHARATVGVRSGSATALSAVALVPEPALATVQVNSLAGHDHGFYRRERHSWA